MTSPQDGNTYEAQALNEIQRQLGLERLIRASADRIQLMRDREPIGAAELQQLVEEAMQELSTTIEELRVSEEELRAQNSELIAAQLAAETEAQRYLELFQLAPDAYFTTNVEAVISEANRAAAEIIGLDEGLLRGKPLAVFFAGEDRRGFRAFTNRVRQSRQAVEVELELQPRKAAPVRLSIRAHASRDRDNAVVAIRWIMRNITDRQQAEETSRKLLQERSEREGVETAALRLRFLSDTGRQLADTFETGNTLEVLAASAVQFMADACFVHVVGDDGSLHLAAEQFRDSSREDFARTVQRRFHLETSSENGPLQRALATGDPQLIPDIPAAVINDGGHDAYFSAMRKLGPRYGMIVPLRARGRNIGVLTFLAVQTSRLYTAEDLRLALELGARAAMQIDNVRLYEAANAANIAKDEILRYAQLCATDEAIKLEDVDLVATANESADFIRHAVEQKSLEMRVDLPAEALTILGDPGKLRQVAINLLTNAVKFTESGSIILQVVRDGDKANLVVSDTGPGIAPEHLDRIFDPFWQAESPVTPAVNGTGLGLSVCRRLVALMNGEIAVVSRPGEGTSFTVRFPLVQGSSV